MDGVSVSTSADGSAVFPMATACAIVLGVAIYLKQPSGLQTNLEDLDLLVAEENLEFYDGLEFYAWLAEEEIDAG